MSEITTRDIERAIQNTQLVSVSEVLFSRINPQLPVLQKSEQLLSSTAVVYAGQSVREYGAGYKLHTEIGAAYSDHARLSGHDKAKHFPELANARDKVNDFSLPTSVSPFAIYCCKTGQPIGTIDHDALYLSLELHGQDGASDLLYYGNLNVPHPAWRKTAMQTTEQYNVTLDKLCDRQPQAYAAYCLGLISQRYLRVQNSSKWQTPQIHAEFHWSLARAYQILGFMPHDDLPDLCDALCHLLTYAPNSTRFLNRLIGNRIKSPDAIAKLALSKELSKLIDKSLDATFTSDNTWREAIDRANYEDARTRESISQIRAQRLSRKHRRNNELRVKKMAQKVAMNKQVSELSELFGTYLGEAREVPGQEKWRNRFDRPEGSKPSNYEPSNFALDVEAIGATELDLDSLMSDQPETRTISWADLAELHAEKLATAERVKSEAEARLAQTAPVMSTANRFSRVAKPSREEAPLSAPVKPVLPSRFARKNTKG